MELMNDTVGRSSPNVLFSKCNKRQNSSDREHFTFAREKKEAAAAATITKINNATTAHI